MGWSEGCDISRISVPTSLLLQGHDRDLSERGLSLPQHLQSFSGHFIVISFEQINERSTSKSFRLKVWFSSKRIKEKNISRKWYKHCRTHFIIIVGIHVASQKNRITIISWFIQINCFLSGPSQSLTTFDFSPKGIALISSKFLKHHVHCMGGMCPFKN